jgi:hypothetical protein
MAVAGVGIERHVAQDADLGHRALDRAHGAAHEVGGIGGFAPVRGLERAVGIGKEGDDRDAELRRLLGRRGEIDGEPLDARHRGTGSRLRSPSIDEKGPDEVGRDRVRFRDQPARPFGRRSRRIRSAGKAGHCHAIGHSSRAQASVP